MMVKTIKFLGKAEKAEEVQSEYATIDPGRQLTYVIICRERIRHSSTFTAAHNVALAIDLRTRNLLSICACALLACSPTPFVFCKVVFSQNGAERGGHVRSSSMCGSRSTINSLSEGEREIGHLSSPLLSCREREKGFESNLKIYKNCLKFFFEKIFFYQFCRHLC